MEMKINNNYNFSVYANSILGASYKNALLVGVMNYESALKVSNVEAIQKQVYKYLPKGTPQDHRKYTYYHFKHRGVNVVLAEHWISSDSVEISTSQSYTITLDSVTDSQIKLIRDQLRLLGLDFKIE